LEQFNNLVGRLTPVTGQTAEKC